MKGFEIHSSGCLLVLNEQFLSHLCVSWEKKKPVDLGVQQQTESSPAVSLDDKTKWNRYYFQMQFSSTRVIWFVFSRKALRQLHQMQSSTSLP